MCTSPSRTTETSQHKRCKTTMIFMGMVCTVLKSLFIVGRRYFDLLIDFIFSLYWDKHREAIPDLDIKHNMLTMSATKMAQDIKDQKLKSEDLVNAVIERIKLVNPIINAIVDERYEAALDEARKIDMSVLAGLSEEDKHKPYLGVPFTCKEAIAVGGMLNAMGLCSRRRVQALVDADAVLLLRRAGAIPLAVSNVPEVCKWQETNNMLIGLTRNPYHSGRTVGGSSGGEAALSASFASPISLCSDIGGSTRMPAFYCGLFGHNPTAGIISVKGSLLRTGQEDTMASLGFVSKNVEDIIPLTKVIAGTNAHLLKMDRHFEMKDIRIFYVETSKDMRMSSIRPELRKAMKRVVAKMTELAPSTDVAPRSFYHEGFSHMYPLWRYWMSREPQAFSKMLTNNTGKANCLVEIAKKMVNMSQYTLAAILKLVDDQLLPAVDEKWAETLTEKLKSDLILLLGHDSVLLFPSAPLPAPYHYSCFLRPFNFAYWCIFNVLRFPSTQVPLGLSEEGLPMGIQVVAAPQNDVLCLTVARYLEKEFGGFVPPCQVIKQ